MLDRRSFMAATAAAVVAPNVTDAKECTKSYDWETMSLEARNLAFNNVAHVGLDSPERKLKSGPGFSATLRAQRPQRLNLAYAQADRTKWDLYPASDPRAPCFVHIHGGYWQRGEPGDICLSGPGRSHTAGRRHYLATL